MSKIIEIHRFFSLIEMSQDDPEVKAWLGESFRPIGPYFKNKTTAIGLSFEEQKLLLPEYLGIEATDKEFRKSVIASFDSILTKVPKEGLKLQIGLQDNDQPLSENNMPLNIKDYITYRHLIDHPAVATDKVTAAREFGKRYFIHDPEKFTQGALDLNTLEDNATVIYMKYKDDLIKLDQILTMMGVNIKSMKPEDKILKLKGFAQKNSKFNAVEQKESFQRFIKTAEDKNLEYKYLIQEMIGAQYLKRVNNTIVYYESGKIIGDNMEDAVIYFKNPKNSRELNLLRAEYMEKIKKPDTYLPKENPEPTSKQIIPKETE